MRTTVLSLAAAFALTGFASSGAQAAPTASLSAIKAGKTFETVAVRKHTRHAPRQATNTRAPITSFSSSSAPNTGGLHVGVIHKSGK
ncbi:MAG: hypothetical protein JO004_06100 [Methylobacteriaceae bacterium]|nr:hypothetical protein [Methylobacteriaceae bacterium]